MTIVYAAIICGLIAVAYGIITSAQVLRAPPGNEKMQDIAAAIQEGAKAYLGRQYRTIAIVGLIVLALVWVFLDGMRTPISAVSFALGAVLSGVAGYVGMNISVRANVRTA
ncbi:MAG: sodium/proton-translocating pyrophosphatase, partial [Sphingomonas sp.]